MAQPEQPPSSRPRSGRLGRLVTVLAAGLVGGLVAPMVYPAIARNARPAGKKALKAGMAAVERGRVAAAEFAEHASDLMAEARAEYENERQLAPASEKAAVSSEVVTLRGSGREAAGT